MALWVVSCNQEAVRFFSPDYDKLDDDKLDDYIITIYCKCQLYVEYRRQSRACGARGRPSGLNELLSDQ